MKSTWHSPYILVDMDPLLTYLLVSVPSILTLRYQGRKLASFLLQDMLSFCRGKRLKGAFGGRQSSGACAKHRCPERNRSRWFREDVGIAWHCIPYSNGWAAFFGIGKFKFSTFLAFLLLFMIETFSLKSSDLSTVPWAFPLVSVWSVKREIPKLMLSEETRW